MLTNISWTDYIVSVIIILTIYYLFIVIKYYSNELKELLSGKRKLKLKVAPHINTKDKNFFYNEENISQIDASFKEIREEGFEDVKQLIERVKIAVANACQKEMNLEELKSSLHRIIKEYPFLRTSSLRSSINELVLSESQKYGLVTLKADELDWLWKDSV